MKANGELVALRGLRKSYNVGRPNEAEVLHGLDLTIARGEFAALIGPSGSGKSTLLNILGLLERPTGGSYRLLGDETTTLDEQALTLRRREALAEAGIVQLLWLETDARRARWLVQDREWADRFDANLSAPETGQILPDTALLARFESRLALAPGEILLIDARSPAVAAAEKRGWKGWEHGPGDARALATALMPLMVRGAV